MKKVTTPEMYSFFLPFCSELKVLRMQRSTVGSAGLTEVQLGTKTLTPSAPV